MWQFAGSINYILVLGGVFHNSDNLAEVRPLCANVVWLYNLYKEQWRMVKRLIKKLHR